MNAELQLDRRGCIACHEVNGRGGTFAKRILDFVPLGTDQTIKDVAPPDLNGIGEKLHLAAIERVVTGDARARPWMDLQMPHFDKAQVSGLLESLIKLDGIDPTAPPPKQPKSTPEQVEQGRLLVGRTGFNCVSCHDIRGVKSIGVRGPDLALVTSRVTHDWFRRWMLDPQRITPGTRMPTVFFGGKSAAPQFLGGEPEAQMAALWAYMSRGESLALPLLPPTQVVAVKGGELPRFVPEGKPMIVHGFMPGVAGLRGIAAGFPAGVHFAFDSERCQLMQAWAGDFAEVGGWLDTGRGTAEDNAVKVLGKPIWQGPDEAAIQLEASDGNLESPKNVQFRACWATPQGVSFAYQLQFTDGTLDVEESVVGSSDSILVRRLVLRGAEAERRVRLTISGGKTSGLYVLANHQTSKEVHQQTDGYIRLAAAKQGESVGLSLLYAARPPRDTKEEQAWRAVLSNTPSNSPPDAK